MNLLAPIPQPSPLRVSRVRPMAGRPCPHHLRSRRFHCQPVRGSLESTSAREADALARLHGGGWAGKAKPPRSETKGSDHGRLIFIFLAPFHNGFFVPPTPLPGRS